MKVIAIDPGHGAPDPGAVGNNLIEADVALAMSWKLADFLDSHGFQVVLTRPFTHQLSHSKGRDLNLRAQIANQAKAWRFVSIHCNAFTNPEANGHETYWHGNSKLGRPFAERINREMAKAFPEMKNRGAKSDFTQYTSGFQVLRQTAMPACLIELGFITNPFDAAILSSDSALDKMAQAIGKAIIEEAENVP